MIVLVIKVNRSFRKYRIDLGKCITLFICFVYFFSKIIYFGIVMSWKNEKPLSTAELLAILDEDEELLQSEIVDAVYIPPIVDEITDEEDFDDDIRENVINLPDVAGTYEIHVISPDTSEDLVNQSIPSSSKKIINKSKKALPKWKKEVPIYTTEPQNEEKKIWKILKIELVVKPRSKFFHCFLVTMFGKTYSLIQKNMLMIKIGIHLQLTKLV